MLRVEFELTTPVFERAKSVHASDHAATVIGYIWWLQYRKLVYFLIKWSFVVHNSMTIVYNQHGSVQGLGINQLVILGHVWEVSNLQNASTRYKIHVVETVFPIAADVIMFTQTCTKHRVPLLRHQQLRAASVWLRTRFHWPPVASLQTDALCNKRTPPQTKIPWNSSNAEVYPEIVRQVESCIYSMEMLVKQIYSRSWDKMDCGDMFTERRCQSRVSIFKDYEKLDHMMFYGPCNAIISEYSAHCAYWLVPIVNWSPQFHIWLSYSSLHRHVLLFAPFHTHPICILKNILY
jgi:hypothetical protein